MPKTNTLPLTQNIKVASNVLVNSSGVISGESGTSVSNLVTIYTCGSNDAIVKSLLLFSSDTANKNVSFYVNNGTADYLIGTITAWAYSGTSGTTINLDFLGSIYTQGFPIDASGKNVMPMQAGHVLKAGIVTTAVTSGKTISITAIVEEY